jgi:hypothetical protein
MLRSSFRPPALLCNASFPAAIIATVLIASARPIAAATVSLTPAADTSLMELTPFNNMGAVESLAAGVTGHGTVARALFRFDLASQVPANATVTDVELRLPVVRQSATVEGGTFGLYRLKLAWGEGEQETPGGGITGTGSAAQVGEATWLARFHPLTVWQEGGGKAGEDYIESPSASAGATDAIDFTSTPDLVADIRAWLAHPESNFGWLLKDIEESPSSMTARRLGSRENPTDQPQLTITYTISTDLRLINTTINAGQFCFQFEAMAGKTYAVERQNILGSGQWDPIQTITPVNSGPVTICEDIGPSPSFFRVAERP